jgi:outer membrane protein TolC
LKIAAALRKAAVAGWAPTLSLAGDYGTSAIKPNEVSLAARSGPVHQIRPELDAAVEVRTIDKP